MKEVSIKGISNAVKAKKSKSIQRERVRDRSLEQEIEQEIEEVPVYKTEKDDEIKIVSSKKDNTKVQARK